MHTLTRSVGYSCGHNFAKGFSVAIFLYGADMKIILRQKLWNYQIFLDSVESATLLALRQVVAFEKRWGKP